MTAYTNHNRENDIMKNYIRTLSTNILAPVMKLTGFRFSRAYRRGDTRYHQIVFACVDTVGANMKAGL
jgi:hypothetical protein